VPGPQPAAETEPPPPEETEVVEDRHPSSSSSPFHRLQVAAAVATIGALVVGVLALLTSIPGAIDSFRDLRGNGQSASSTSPGPSRTDGRGVTAPPAGGTAPSGGSVRPSVNRPAVGSCLLPETGGEVACATAGSGLVIDAGSCAATTFLAAAGLDPDLDALGVAVRRSGSACLAVPARWVTPDPTSGATLRVVLETRRVPDALRECARRASTDSLPCSRPHEVEWVGPWRPNTRTSGENEQACLSSARTYSDDSLDDPQGPLRSQVFLGSQGGRPFYRCALVTDQTSSSSVRDAAFRQQG
jgi:hypothetical protein